MPFYDRENELDALSLLKDGRGGRLIVITGRRRVGKTTLIKHFLEGVSGSIYLYVDSTKRPATLMSEFSESVRTVLGLPDYFLPRTWEQLFEAIYSSEKPVIVAIDEFQRFLDLDKGAIYALQKVHDLRHDRTNANILISGSAVGMLKRMFADEQAPLYKRAVNMIDIQPFDVVTCFDIYRKMGVKDIGEMVRLYACFGDLPMMFYLFEEYGVKSLDDALAKLLLRPFAPLRNEVSDTMVESFGKEHPTYFAIISAISQGKHGTVEIANQVGINPTSLSPYMTDLEDVMGVLTSEKPVTERVGSNSKKGRYVLKDNFYKFWFRFFYKNASLTEGGSWDVLGDVISGSMDEYVSRQVEELIHRLILAHRLDLGVTPHRLGCWWSRKGDEIDIVALDDERKQVVFGEVKWSKNPVGMDVVSALIAKSDLVDGLAGYKKRFFVFNRSGFTKEAMTRMQRDGVMHLDLDGLQKALNE